MENSIEALVEVAKFGNQVESFLSREIGTFHLVVAEEEVNSALRQLKRIDPEDVKSMRALQAQIWRWESFRNWLGESVVAGLKALDVLEDRED